MTQEHKQAVWTSGQGVRPGQRPPGALQGVSCAIYELNSQEATRPLQVAQETTRCAQGCTVNH